MHTGQEFYDNLLGNVLIGVFNDDLDALEADLEAFVEHGRKDTRFAWHKFWVNASDPKVLNRSLLTAVRIEKHLRVFNDTVSTLDRSTSGGKTRFELTAKSNGTFGVPITLQVHAVDEDAIAILGDLVAISQKWSNDAHRGRVRYA